MAPLRLRYELRRFLYALILCFIPCALLLATLLVLYVYLRDDGGTEGVSRFLAELPVPARRFFSLYTPLDLSDPLAYFIRASAPVYVLSAVMTLVTAARALNAEESSGLAEYLHAQPDSRGFIYLRRLLGGFAFVLALHALLCGLSIGGFLILRVERPAYYAGITAIFCRSALVQSVLWCLGFLCSALTHRAGRGVWAALLALALLTAAALFPAFWNNVGFLMYFSPLHYAAPEWVLHNGLYFNWLQLLVLGGMALACALPGYFVYRYKEIDLVV